ncbi:MAG: 16S rRNA (cytosine(1402)-N(4))-methyltransferase, partial [Candidatus Marinimicrobia bacterium]|nr:16S rRNA (cytosine(1402)-N(4))-methyltransferase [Candidatus Neomarinimicrobiota bacterium]
MSTEALNCLNIQPEGTYIDGTIGAGGHATQILSKLSSKGKLIGIDRDAKALEICYERFRSSAHKISLHHSSYH